MGYVILMQSHDLHHCWHLESKLPKQHADLKQHFHQKKTNTPVNDAKQDYHTKRPQSANNLGFVPGVLAQGVHQQSQSLVEGKPSKQRKQNPQMTFHCAGWFIGNPDHGSMVYNPYITG